MSFKKFHCKLKYILETVPTTYEDLSSDSVRRHSQIRAVIKGIATGLDLTSEMLVESLSNDCELPDVGLDPAVLQSSSILLTNLITSEEAASGFFASPGESDFAVMFSFSYIKGSVEARLEDLGSVLPEEELCAYRYLLWLSKFAVSYYHVRMEAVSDLDALLDAEGEEVEVDEALAEV